MTDASGFTLNDVNWKDGEWWDDQEYWLKVWKAASAAIDSMRNTLKHNPDIPDVDNISDLLNCLEQFAWQQANYFFYGFTYDNLKPDIGIRKEDIVAPADQIDPSIVSLSKGHVMRVTLKQIRDDITALDSIINNRRTGKDYEIKILKLTENLAYSALQAAEPLLKKDKEGNTISPVVFSYYTENTPGHPKEDISIRLVPYVNAAFIGIPAPADESGDVDGLTYGNLLAIPHEIGHYVFWHGEKTRNQSYLDVSNWKNQTLNSIINKNHDEELAIDASVYNYQEEIFADVYSALIAGPLTALSSQFYLGKLPPSELKKDDSDHPISAVRPYIYADTCKSLNKNNNNNLDGWKNKLIHLWEANPEVSKKPLLRLKPNKMEKFLVTIIKDQSKHDQIKNNIGANAAGNGREVGFDKLRDRISNVVEDIVEKLDDQKLGNSDFWPSFSDRNPDDVKEKNGFALVERNSEYDWFIQKVKKGEIPEWSEIPNLICKPYLKIVREWDITWANFEPRWLRIFKADGWTTEGPSNPW